MLFKAPSYLSLLATILFWVPCRASDIKTYYTSFDGMTDPSNYMFYDPTESCKNSTGLCLTSFKYCTDVDDPSLISYRDIIKCPTDVKKDNLSWITSDKDDAVTWIETHGRPMVIYSQQGDYSLRWQNHNPKYPTNITWNTVYASSSLSFHFYTGKLLTLYSS